MKRIATIVCTATLAVAALAGCGSDDGNDDSNASGGESSSDSSGGDYCDQVADVKGSIDGMSATATLADLQHQTDSMNAAADAAPDDIASSWSKLADASDTIVSALRDAGVKDDDKLQDAMQPGSDVQKAMSEAGKSLPNLEDDTKAISTDVKDECDIDLGASSAQ